MSAGRPALFENDEQLQQAVEDYFAFIKGEFHFEADPIDEAKDIKVWDTYPERASITGLALFLGFESRQSIYDYESKGEFSYTIKRARLRVEAAYEQALLTNVATGAIFALKNFGWKDTIDNTNRNVNYNTDLSTEKLKEISDKLDGNY